MGQSVPRKRPWLAALLAALVTGLGHLYLRRVGRALAWLAAIVATGLLFVDASALEALARRESVELPSITPLLIVGTLNVVDAYLLARAQNSIARLSNAATGELTHCPNCGKELDPDLEFCHWCSAPTGNPRELTEGEEQ